MSDHMISMQAIRAERKVAAETNTALRKQVAELRAALEAVSNEADEWDDHDGRLAHVAYPTILDVRRVLAATQPQEVQS